MKKKRTNKRLSKFEISSAEKGQVPKTTVEKMREAFERSAKRMKEAEEERSKSPKVTNGTCVVCKGVVSGEYEQVADRHFTQIPLGPASRSCYSWRFQGYHCTKCGIKYEFLPERRVIDGA